MRIGEIREPAGFVFLAVIMHGEGAAFRSRVSHVAACHSAVVPVRCGGAGG